MNCAVLICPRLEGVVAWLSGVLKQGTQGGELRPMDHEVVARTIISLIGWVPHTCFWTERISEGPMDKQVMVLLLNDLLIKGWAQNRQAPVPVRPFDLQELVTQITPFDRDSLAKAKRERILATAIRLFNWKGIDTTSLDEIAAELKVTKRTLYQQVGDKETLIQACFNHSDLIWQHIYQPADEQALHKRHSLTGLLRNLARAQQHTDLQPLRAMRSLEAYAPDSQSYLRKRVGGLTRALYRLFDEAHQVGEMRDVDHPLLRMIILGPSAWLTGWSQTVDDSTKLQTSLEVTDVLRIGLKAI